MSKEIVKKDKAQIDIEKGKDFFEHVSSLDTEKPFVEPRCKLCNTAFRAEAESMWEKTNKNSSAVQRWLTTEKKFDITEQSVRLHMRSHYSKVIRDIQLQEYAKNLKNNWVDVYQSEEQKLENYIAIMDSQIHSLASQNNPTDICDSRKTNECIAKLMDQSMKMQERLDNMRNATEPVKILVEKFKNIIKIQVENIKSPEVKKVLGDIWQQLEKEMEGVEIDAE